MKHIGQLSYVSFQFMKDHPDTAYFDVLQAYHRRQFYRFSGFRPHGFTGFPADKASPEDFIHALVAQQTEKSARLLDTILTNLRQFEHMPDKEAIIEKVITAIWEHPCPAYTELRKKIKPKAEELAKRRVPFIVDRSPVFSDTIKRTFRWCP